MVVHKPLPRVRVKSDPDPLSAPQRAARMRAAAVAAQRNLPGPLGDWVARELDGAANFTPYYGRNDALVWLVVDQLINMRSTDAAAKD